MKDLSCSVLVIFGKTDYNNRDAKKKQTKEAATCRHFMHMTVSGARYSSAAKGDFQATARAKSFRAGTEHITDISCRVPIIGILSRWKPYANNTRDILHLNDNKRNLIPTNRILQEP